MKMKRNVKEKNAENQKEKGKKKNAENLKEKKGQNERK